MAEKETIKKSPELNAEVKELAEKISASYENDHKAGVGTPPESIYNDNMPEGLTPEIDKAVDDYRAIFIPAATFAAAKKNIETLGKNESLDQVSTEFSVGSVNKLTVINDREKTFTNSFGDKKPVTRYGNTTTVYDVKGVRNGGQLKNARKIICELAAQSLGKKK